MVCHGSDGAGNAAARYPALRGQQSEYTVLQLKAFRDGKRKTDPQQMMCSTAEKMSDADMNRALRLGVTLGFAGKQAPTLLLSV